jgi:hypothetical protein
MASQYSSGLAQFAIGHYCVFQDYWGGYNHKLKRIFIVGVSTAQRENKEMSNQTGCIGQTGKRAIAGRSYTYIVNQPHQ